MLLLKPLLLLLCDFVLFRLFHSGIFSRRLPRFSAVPELLKGISGPWVVIDGYRSGLIDGYVDEYIIVSRHYPSRDKLKK